MIVHNFDPVFIDLGFFKLGGTHLRIFLELLYRWMYANKIIKLTENNQ